MTLDSHIITEQNTRYAKVRRALHLLWVAWQQYRALLQPPMLDRAVDNTPQERQGRFLGSLFSVALPIVVLGCTAGLLTHKSWAIVLGPLGLALLVGARLNHTGRIQAAKWLVLAMLTFAVIGTEISGLSRGLAPLCFAAGSVFLSGFLVGRWKPFAFAAIYVVTITAHVHMLLNASTLPLVSDDGPPLAWRPVISATVLSLVALLTGSLEDSRTRRDDMASNNSALADANARLKALATTDPLTGLLNHRGLVTALDAELDRSHRGGRPCALLFVDIDHFKALNDGYGHATGDAILQEFARLLRDSLRQVDLLGRWGGEEFVILLPEMDPIGAAIVAERVRVGVAGHVFPTASGLHLTCSVGIAGCSGEAAQRDLLLDAADRAMYAAKRLGRNQVRSAGDPAVAILLMDIEGNGSREEAAVLGTVEALTLLATARDDDKGKHAQEVAALALNLAAALGMDVIEARMVGLAGRLHDIGKAGIPDAILYKTGRLSEDEDAVIRHHPLLGAEVVSHVPTLRALAQLIRGQHERWDGEGCPDSLAGEAIPLGARILAVADSYLAMTHDQPDCPARDQNWALEQIEQQSGTQFDPGVVEALKSLLRPTIKEYFSPRFSAEISGIL